MAEVRVHDVKGSFITDLGKPSLPASVKAFDFSALDKAMAVESEINEKALAVAQANVKDMGRIKDELTNITSPSLYHAGQLEAAKNDIGLNREAFAQAANNVDDAVAMFDIDRKMKKLSADPRVKDSMRDNAIMEAAKMAVPTIEDPGLRAIAIKDIDAASKNADDPNAIKNLNMSVYKSVDLETAYEKALDQFAPYLPTTEDVTGPDGRTHTRTIQQRDPEMVAKTRKYFMDNATVKNNLFAKGYIDDKGEVVAGGWFDDIEAPQLVPIETNSNYSATPKGGSGGSVGDASYTPSEGLTQINTTPEVVTDEGSGASFDVSVISAVETAGRSPKNLVHIDPGTQKNPEKVGINVGAYSFNKDAATSFINALPDMLAESIGSANPVAIGIVNELQALKFKGPESIKPENVKKVKDLYLRLDEALGGDLKKMEDKFAVQEFGVKAVDYMHTLKGTEDMEFSTGDSTLMMDTAIQFGINTWKEFFRNYAEHVRDDGSMGLKEFITNQRNAWYNKTYGAKEAQTYKDRAYKVYYAATQMDGGEDRTGSTAGDGTGTGTGTGGGTAAFGDPSTYGKYIPGIQQAADVAVTEDQAAAVDYWRKTPAQP